MTRINFNNSTERNFYGISEETVSMLNSLEDAVIEFEEETEKYYLYVNGDCVDANEDPNKLER